IFDPILSRPASETLVGKAGIKCHILSPHRNHCAYVVQKNITCIMQDGAIPFVKAEYTTKCIWGQKCPVVMYRTIYKPKYKVGYKTVTELEWRCCPGYSGESCVEGPTSEPGVIMPPYKGAALPHRPRVKGFPHGPRPPERLRTSLREDTNKILVSLLPNTPRTPDSSVGFGVIPDGHPDGLEGQESFNGFGDLAGRVTEVRDELRGMVLGHDGQLKKLLETPRGRPIAGSNLNVEEIVNQKLAGVRSEILDGFEQRLIGLESHCDKMISEVQQQCHRDHMNGQEKMQQSLDGRETGLRKELGTLQAQIQGLTLTESCCGQVNSLSQRMLLLEDSVKGLTESQRQMQTALADQNIEVETLIETRFLDIENRLNSTTDGATITAVSGLPSGLDGFKTMLEDKLKMLEEKVFVAVGELSNATSPALLEGQLIDLELLCASSCVPSTSPAGGINGKGVEDCEDVEKKMNGRLDNQSNQLDLLNNTLQNLLFKIAQEELEGSVSGEITLLKVNIHSVNKTLRGLKDSIRFIASEVGHANATWEQRENQIVNQVQGITKVVGHQASLLGAGERRLAHLKGELVALKRRLSGELQGCKSTALEVKKEVKDVDSRVSQVEGQCSGLGELTEHLEQIREELERHSDTYLAKVNGTLTVHSAQLAELKDEVKECIAKEAAASRKGDQ
uniref:EMI domain-containing protein n=1 Tax=Periophthalmus magnuspinnatus TaxID=409849 RepID=A0A3B4A163_9GOBI